MLRSLTVVLYSFSFIADGVTRRLVMKLKKFAKWWKAASPDAKRALAKASGSSYNSLSNAAQGLRDIGPERAGRIESALAGELSRGELCETCRRCPYYQEGR